MALRNPVKITTLKILTVQQYVKMVTLLLKKFTEGDEIPFTIMLKHVYKGLDKNRSDKMPLFLFGTPADGTNKWKTYCDAMVKQDSDALVRGTCIMQEGKVIKMNIQKTKGASKIPRKKLEYLNAFLKKLGDYSMVTDAPRPQRPRPQNVVAGAVAGAGTGKTPQREPTEEEKQEHIQLRQEEAQQMSESLSFIDDIVSSSLGDVTTHIGNGATSADDVKAMKDLVEQFQLFETIYKKTGGEVDRLYKPAHEKLLAKKRQLYKAAKLTKSLAKSKSDLGTLSLANAYYRDSDERVSNQEKLRIFRPIFEQIIAYTKETGMKQRYAIKIASYLLRNRGIENFRVEAIQVVAVAMEGS